MELKGLEPLTPCLQSAVSTCEVGADQGCDAPGSVREAPLRTGVNGTLMAQRPRSCRGGFQDRTRPCSGVGLTWSRTAGRAAWLAVIPCISRCVHAGLTERSTGGFRALSVHCAHHLLADNSRVSSGLGQGSGGGAFALLAQGQQDVLGPDVVVGKLQRPADRLI